jgi:hypothetical protein
MLTELIHDVLARGFPWVQQGLLNPISFGGDEEGGSQIHTKILRAICRRLCVTYPITRKCIIYFFQQDREQTYKTINPYVV